MQKVESMKYIYLKNLNTFLEIHRVLFLFCRTESTIILNYKRLCPSVSESHHFIISDLNI